jgi:NAD(P)-dependent dehydrogenase (short-subunit alcohol dehydrogenase family)
MRLADKVAIVTGGGKGIGKAIALAFAEEGAKVVVVARTPKEIGEVAQGIITSGGEAIAIQADIADEDDVAKMVREGINRFQRLDILVNNAGINLPYRTLLDITLPEWNQIIAVNLTGAFLCMKAVLPKMIEQHSGKIINISSIGARHGSAGRGPYRAAKAGLVNLTETVAAEVKEFGIDVNALCVGPTDTPMQVAIRHGKVPSGLMRPEEVASVVVFLASKDASGITATAIDVFGRWNPIFGSFPEVQPAAKETR